MSDPWFLIILVVGWSHTDPAYISTFGHFARIHTAVTDDEEQCERTGKVISKSFEQNNNPNNGAMSQYVCFKLSSLKEEDT